MIDVNPYEAFLGFGFCTDEYAGFRCHFDGVHEHPLRRPARVGVVPMDTLSFGRDMYL